MNTLTKNWRSLHLKAKDYLLHFEHEKLTIFSLDNLEIVEIIRNLKSDIQDVVVSYSHGIIYILLSLSAEPYQGRHDCWDFWGIWQLWSLSLSLSYWGKLKHCLPTTPSKRITTISSLGFAWARLLFIHCEMWVLLGTYVTLYLVLRS